MSLRAHVEDFLYADALLLDEWRLDEWLDRFTADAVYLVPPLGRPDADPDQDGFLVNDNRFKLEQRVASLQKRTAWAESPHSTTRRLVTNVRAESGSGGLVDAAANFCVFRFRLGDSAQFVGRLFLRLQPMDTSFRVARRTAVLDHGVLRPQGAVSILL